MSKTTFIIADGRMVNKAGTLVSGESTVEIKAEVLNLPLMKMLQRECLMGLKGRARKDKHGMLTSKCSER